PQPPFQGGFCGAPQPPRGGLWRSLWRMWRKAGGPPDGPDRAPGRAAAAVRRWRRLLVAWRLWPRLGLRRRPRPRAAGRDHVPNLPRRCVVISLILLVFAFVCAVLAASAWPVALSRPHL